MFVSRPRPSMLVTEAAVLSVLPSTVLLVLQELFMVE